MKIGDVKNSGGNSTIKIGEKVIANIEREGVDNESTQKNHKIVNVEEEIDSDTENAPSSKDSAV